MNKNLIANISTFAVVTVMTMVLAGVAVADSSPTQCQPIYGGGQNCVPQGALRINKQIEKPVGKGFVDNLVSSDEKFAPEGTAVFKLIVTNTGSTNLINVVAKDILPAHVSFVSGGTYDQATRTVSIPVGDLPAGQSKEVTITVKIASANQLPSDETTCVVNQAIVTANNTPEHRDSAQFCIAKPGQMVTKGGQVVQPAPKMVTTPSTGPEAFALFGLLPSAIAGFILRRKSA